MCGILGIVRMDGRSISAAALEQSLAKLAHRGPDDRGLWIDPHDRCALGNTRLAIIDLAGGQQPLANEDGQIRVVLNGEIYNHVELRRQLEPLGHRFRTRSDTEVLVHLYEEHGEGLFAHLRGMFALAIWDTRQRKLLLGRDRLGKKPLFFCRRPGYLAFASEIKGLWPLVDLSPALDPAALFHYLTYQHVPGDLCAFQGLEKLQPGEFLCYGEAGIQRARYWQVPLPRASFRGTPEDAAVELRHRLREATRIRLRSDVPLGVLLSGGIDSAVVVGLMAECGAGPMRTFTAVFQEADFDERPFARAVAQRFGTRHEELRIEPPSADLLTSIIDQYDEPFADSSAIATSLICRLARRHVKVALTGDGGDESLLGYTRYDQYRRYLRQRRWLGPFCRLSGLRAAAIRLCPEPGPRTWRRRLRSLATLWDAQPAEVYERWLGAFMGRAKERLCTRELLQAVNGRESSKARTAARLQRLYGGDWPAAAAALDMATYLPDAVLTKVDRASMAHGLECRSPLLDHQVVEFLATLPSEWKLHPRYGSKWILRQACRDLLPDAVYHRGKMGFAVPIGRWFRTVWSDHLEEACLPAEPLRSWLATSYVSHLINEHRSGIDDHTFRLWTLAALNRAVWALATHGTARSESAGFVPF